MIFDAQFNLGTMCSGLQLGEDGIYYSKLVEEKAEHPRDSAEPKGETNVWPREGNRSVAEQCGKVESEVISYPEEGKCRNSGLWDSLNFITSPWIKKICIRNRLVVSFEKGILHRTLCRPEEDPEFLKRQSNSCFCRRRRIPIHCWAIRFDQMGLIRPNFK